MARAYESLNLLKKPPEKEGYLEKAASAKKGKDEYRGGWKRRYFVLKREILAYYKKKEDYDRRGSKAKGEINLKSAKIDDYNTVTNTNRSHCFKIYSLKNHSFTYIHAKSRDEADEWIYYLRKASGYDEEGHAWHVKLVKPRTVLEREEKASHGIDLSKLPFQDRPESKYTSPSHPSSIRSSIPTRPASTHTSYAHESPKERTHTRPASVGGKPSLSPYDSPSFKNPLSASHSNNLSTTSHNGLDHKYSKGSPETKGERSESRTTKRSQSTARMRPVDHSGGGESGGGGSTQVRSQSRSKASRGYSSNEQSPQDEVRPMTPSDSQSTVPSTATRSPKGRALPIPQADLFDSDDESYVLGWGAGPNGQLGNEANEVQLGPVLIRSLTTRQVRSIAVGRAHAGAVTEKGFVYMWGKNEKNQLGFSLQVSETNSPTLVQSLVKDPIQILACGNAHTLALSLQGNVYSWGSGECGQLGHRSTVDEPLPKIIKKFVDNKCRFVGAGGDSSAAIVNEYLCTWGDNTFGQLGTKNTHNRDSPIAIVSLTQSGQRIKQISVGIGFLAVVTESGKLFTCGSNSHGQLGYSGPVYMHTPTEVKKITQLNNKCLSVSLGETHMVALVQAQDLSTSALTWGSISKAPKAANTLDVLPWVSYVSASQSHSFVLYENGTSGGRGKRLWGSGTNQFGQLGTGNTLEPKTPQPFARCALSPKVHIVQVECGLCFTIALCKGQVPTEITEGVIERYMTEDDRYLDEDKETDEAMGENGMGISGGISEEDRYREEEQKQLEAEAESMRQLQLEEKRKALEEHNRRAYEEEERKRLTQRRPYGGESPRVCSVAGCGEERVQGLLCVRHFREHQQQLPGGGDINSSVNMSVSSVGSLYGNNNPDSGYTSDPDVPSDWKRLRDQKTGRYYYVYIPTMQAQWAKPPRVAPRSVTRIGAEPSSYNNNSATQYLPRSSSIDKLGYHPRVSPSSGSGYQTPTYASHDYPSHSPLRGGIGGGQGGHYASIGVPPGIDSNSPPMTTSTTLIRLPPRGTPTSMIPTSSSTMLSPGSGGGFTSGGSGYFSGYDSGENNPGQVRLSSSTKPGYNSIGYNVSPSYEDLGQPGPHHPNNHNSFSSPSISSAISQPGGSSFRVVGRGSGSSSGGGSRMDTGVYSNEVEGGSSSGGGGVRYVRTVNDHNSGQGMEPSEMLHSSGVREEESLIPSGWQKVWDPNHSRFYYYNTNTRQSVWQPPGSDVDSYT